jgi:hypothetical protein
MIQLTYAKETAVAAYPVLEQVIEIQVALALTTEYGMPLID